jgi:hypothetical protein
MLAEMVIIRSILFWYGMIGVVGIASVFWFVIGLFVGKSGKARSIPVIGRFFE